MPKPHRMKQRAETNYIAVHCTATDPDWHGPTTLEDLHRWHVEDRGWTDIGYNLFIPRNGDLLIARSDEAEGTMNDLEIQGAHVRGYNDEAFAICLDGGVKVQKTETGTLSLPENNFTDRQMRTLRVAVWSGLIKYPNAKVWGHRDFPGVAKACPSFDVISWWEANKPANLYHRPL